MRRGGWNGRARTRAGKPLQCEDFIDVGAGEKMTIAQSGRLRLRELTHGDADFILELLNTPGFIRYIGDRGVRNLDDAGRYISEGPRASYAANGFGLWLVESRQSGEPLGISGLLKRPVLADVDLGFAFLPAACGQNFAFESAAVVLEFARQALGLARVVAITKPDNLRSIHLLEKLGFDFERMILMPGDDADVRLFGCDMTQISG
jgi:RimJ/RimL family protein N-acetyltransferase